VSTKNEIPESNKNSTNATKKVSEGEGLGPIHIPELMDEPIPEGESLTERLNNSHGKIGWAVLWLLGVPLPILFILFLLRGCT
jgi:hypothetical protein